MLSQATSCWLVQIPLSLQNTSAVEGHHQKHFLTPFYSAGSISTRTTIFLSFDSCKIIRDYKSMELDCLLLQIFWETLSECCFGAKADGMAALPFLVPAEGRFKLRILAEFLCL